MIQLYFLSILCNSLCGYILFDGNEGENSKKIEALNNPTFQLVLGILSIVTGVLKILSPTMDRLPILGDLIPAAAGVIGGMIIVFGISREEKSSPSPGSLEVLGTSLLRFRKPLGLGLLASALLHFLFPDALFL
jgi:hypothetical protein